MKLKNYLGVPINIYGADGAVVQLPLHGRAEYVAQTRYLDVKLEYGDGESAIPVTLGTRVLKEVRGLPDPEEGVLYLVGKDVAEIARVARDDLVIVGDAVTSGSKVLGFLGVHRAQPEVKETI
jgi:hypothetical protein